MSKIENLNFTQANLIINNIKTKLHAKSDEVKERIKIFFQEVNFNEMSVEEKTNYFVEILTSLNKEYYTYDNPLISDDDYDILRDEYLAVLAPKHEFFKKIGEAEIQEEAKNKESFFRKEEHDRAKYGIPEGSLNKARKESHSQFVKDLEEFGDTKTISDKMDGITVVISYTPNKEEAYEEIEDMFSFHEEYVKASNKNAKEKTNLLNYIKQQKLKLFKHVEETPDNHLVAYKVMSRGDGSVGENITINAINFKGLINSIPYSELKVYHDNPEQLKVFVRAEAVVTRTDFKGLPYKNQRNAVALHRGQDGKNTEHITMYAFDTSAIDTKEKNLISLPKSKQFKWLENQKFNVPFNKTVETTKEIEEEIEKRFIQRENEEIEYLIDGMVIDAEEKGKFVGNKPKGAIAYKPNPEVGYGICEEIIMTVGRTGNITPVMKLEEPILISGSEVQYISLANIDRMKEIRPKKGGVYGIVKSGEVIPYVKSNEAVSGIVETLEAFVIEDILETSILAKADKEKLFDIYQANEIEKIFNKNMEKDLATTIDNFLKEILKDKYEKALEKTSFQEDIKKVINKWSEKGNQIIAETLENEISYPTNCPCCGSELSRKSKVLVKCLNKGCEDKVLAQYTFFAKKLTDNIGPGIVKQLYNNGTLKSYADFFKIKKEDFMIGDTNEFIGGWKETSIENFLSAVNNIKKSKDKDFLSSLFFENIGETVFQKLFQKIPFTELKEILSTMKEPIQEVESYLDLPKEKFLKQLKSENHPYFDLIKRLSEVEDWGVKRIIGFINTWIEEEDQINELLSSIEIIPTEILTANFDLTVCITGSIDYVPDYIQGKSKRNDLTAFIKGIGGKVAGSVSKNTQFLISDSPATSDKFKTATSLGVPIVTSKEFFETIPAGETRNYEEIMNDLAFNKSPAPKQKNQNLM